LAVWASSSSPRESGTARSARIKRIRGCSETEDPQFYDFMFYKYLKGN